VQINKKVSYRKQTACQHAWSTVQNLVICELYMGSQKFWGTMRPSPLRWECACPLETCYGPSCVIIPNFVALGQITLVMYRSECTYRSSTISGSSVSVYQVSFWLAAQKIIF